MGKIFCMMGKSVSGKDTIYKEIMRRGELPLRPVVPYTTRPIRDGEEQGVSYFFTDDAEADRLLQENRIIELRSYSTVYGIWRYFTADDGQIDLDRASYLLIGTLESYLSFRSYFGSKQVVPVYVEVEDGERLLRAIAREKTQTLPKYEEMCRRFLTDAADFSEEKLKAAGIEKRFENRELEETIGEITDYIRSRLRPEED